MLTCAEHGISGEAASAMLKQAGWFSWGKQNRDLARAHNDMLERAWAGGYDKYINKHYRAGNMPGTAVGRLWQRLWHGGSGFANRYKPDLERALDEARGKWWEEYNNAPPEVKRLMRLETIQRRKSYNALKLQEARGKYQAGASEAARLDKEKDKPAQNETPFSREQFVRRYVNNNNLPSYSYYRTYRDPTTMMWASSDPNVKLPDELVRQNAQIESAWEDYQRGQNKPKPKPETTPEPDSSLFTKNAPKQTWLH